MKKRLPKIFCWSRMGAESGQDLELILARKELERKACDERFIWGIGNSLGEKIWEFIRRIKEPKVLFSKIKSKAKSVDSNPSKVYLWTQYIDKEGALHNLPEKSLVLSKAQSQKALKKKHYALFCHKKNEITKEDWQPINFAKLKNLYSNTTKLGYSQITAIVERNGYKGRESNYYDVEFSADFAGPCFIALANPMDFPIAELNKLNNIIKENNLTVDDWNIYVSDIKKRITKPKFFHFQYQNKLPL